MKVYRIFEQDGKTFGELEVDGHCFPIFDRLLKEHTNEKE